MIKAIQDDLAFNKQEVQVLRQEKSSLEQNLTLQTQDVRKTLQNELFKVEEDIKRHFAHQKQENARYQQQITAFRGEKTALDMQMLELERRMTTLEQTLGGAV
jgi:chromosome segregation ATPase